ncbi:hypothetical protein C2G38_2033298 [Gigaspora rosea]|uniref:Peptidase S1 domain-containing protein n=1 Tax=Gigaspora rosea TaxID=44941 RepID=A0A397VP98_9GLOM|nr:hypothetical protein C2G38_2033298 [Gigaspora rosea]
MSGGEGILLYNNITKKYCSFGFLARGKRNYYFATAGHCYLESARCFLVPWESKFTPTAFIGKTFFHRLEKIDFSLITIQNEDFEPIPTIRNTDSKVFPDLLLTEDYIVVSSNGAHLCLSGLISHVKCGFVESLNGFASIYAKYVSENIFAVSMVGENGDSGGSVFSYKQDMPEWYSEFG